jgi:hypothetical protein
MIRYVRVSAVETLPPIEKLRPFKAILVAEIDMSDSRRSEVCKWLVEAGCRYFMAWGRECERWHDFMDEVYLTSWDFRPPDDALLITTWHADQALAEVFWFARYVAVHPATGLRNILIVHAGSTDREGELLGACSVANSDTS